MKAKALEDLKVALVYDRVNKSGGAERVLVSLAKLLPKAPLFTLVYADNQASWAKSIHVIPSYLNKVSFFQTRHELLAPIAALAFEQFDFSRYDLVISVTSSDAKAIITKPSTYHLCYCLTPTRYLWSHTTTYRSKPGFGYLNNIVSFILSKFIDRLRKNDLVYAARPDSFVAISKTVQSRIKKYYQRNSSVIYPPINDYFFSGKLEAKKKDYYLLVSRLVPYKKVDLAIRAFNKLDRKLVIVGTGNQSSYLKRIAGKTIFFTDLVNDYKLRSYYQQAKAVIVPQSEDFGLVPLEAQACGTGVIAYDKSGNKETVVANKTGIFFEKQTVSAIIKADKKYDKLVFDPKDCRNWADKFREKHFHKQMTAKIIKDISQSSSN